MPEIAEVETVRKHLEQILRGKKIKEVVADEKDRYIFAFAPAKDVRKALTGSKIVGSGRKGKYFWLKFDRKPWLIIHLGMTGNVAVLSPKLKGPHRYIWGDLSLQSTADQDKPERLWFCRLLLKMSDGTEVALTDPRRFGRIWLTDDPESHPRILKLGYDPLLDFPSATELAKKIQKRRAPIKAVLLDQKIFAGIGNWLADEILYQSRLSPHRLTSELKAKDVALLRKSILAVVKKAVAVDANYEKFPKSWLFHHRWGKTKGSKTQKGPIIYEEIGGRTSAWVPKWQK